MIYDADTLIAEWKLRRLLEPQRTDASLRRYDAIDLDAYIMRRIDEWYRRLLDTAPVHLLVVHDITSRLSPAGKCGRGAVFGLPADCRRLVEVVAAGGSPPAVITPAGSELAARQACPFSCGGVAGPVAVTSHGHMTLYGLPAGAGLPERVMAVVTPPEGVYEMNPAALDLINLPME